VRKRKNKGQKARDARDKRKRHKGLKEENFGQKEDTGVPLCKE
jgi:hypothetical protein